MDANKKLEGTIECTEWDVFMQALSSLDEMTEVLPSKCFYLINQIIPT